LVDQTSENSASTNGGGLFASTQSRGNFTDCLWTFNGANNYGGAVYVSGTEMNFENNVFSHNGADYGGAICFNVVEVTLSMFINCTIRYTEKSFFFHSFLPLAL
jgi:hypothetical protein